MPLPFQIGQAGYVPPDPMGEIQPGYYDVVITSAVVETFTPKKPPGPPDSGSLLKVEFTFLEEGPYKGRKQFSRFNLVHPDASVAERGIRDLERCAAVAGITPLNDESQLVNQVLAIKVILKPGAEYPNDVRGFEVRGHKGAGGGVAAAAPAAGAAAPAVATQAPQAQAAAPAAQPAAPQAQQPIPQQQAAPQAQAPVPQQPVAQPPVQQPAAQPPVAQAPAPATQAPPVAAAAPVAQPGQQAPWGGGNAPATVAGAPPPPPPA